VEKDFFELYRRHELLALEVGHNSIAGWNVIVYDKRSKPTGDWGEPVINCSGCHRELVFAEAYAKLAGYFSEQFGGY
jgi:hypothetical protein